MPRTVAKKVEDNFYFLGKRERSTLTQEEKDTYMSLMNVLSDNKILLHYIGSMKLDIISKYGTIASEDVLHQLMVEVRIRVMQKKNMKKLAHKIYNVCYDFSLYEKTLMVVCFFVKQTILDIEFIENSKVTNKSFLTKSEEELDNDDKEWYDIDVDEKDDYFIINNLLINE